MKNKIYFDHCYTIDTNHTFLKSLQRLGFNLGADSVEHPNANCRFLGFESNQYLEFVHNTEKLENIPGFSFGYSEDLKKLEQKLSNRISCMYKHRSQDGSKSGWNFLFFKNIGIRTFIPWFTEYEQSLTKKSKRKLQIKHPNGVTKILAHEFTINDKGKDFFQTILNLKIKSSIKLQCGTTLYFERGRTNYHSKVILECKSFPLLKRYMPKKKTSLFQGKKSIFIPNLNNNKRMWDLYIQERSD